MRHGHQIVREGSTKRNKGERERELVGQSTKQHGFPVGWVEEEKEKSKICKSS